MGFEVRQEFRKNETLESLLREINGLLGPVEDSILENYRMPKYPVVVIVGAPRCGSTITMQWLAHTGKFAYPTNLLSRFCNAPYIGARIQQILTEFDYNNEIFDFNKEVPFVSNLGKTKGALAPHEFWYFWRRFFHATDTHHLDEEALKEVDAKKFAAELAALEAVFDKPLLLKGLIINWNIPFVSSILEKVLFIYVKRHPFYNIQSQLEARAKYFGDRRPWHSFKPREYHELKELDPIEQVVGQIYFTNRAIEEGLSQIHAARGLQINYEQFCMAPEQAFDKIIEKLAQQGYEVDWSYTGPEKFQSANWVRLPEDDCERIVNAYKHFSGMDVTP